MACLALWLTRPRSAACHSRDGQGASSLGSRERRKSIPGGHGQGPRLARAKTDLRNTSGSKRAVKKVLRFDGRAGRSHPQRPELPKKHVSLAAALAAVQERSYLFMLQETASPSTWTLVDVGCTENQRWPRPAHHALIAALSWRFEGCPTF